MPAINAMPDVALEQKQTLGIDFGNFLPEGVTLTGAPTAVLTAVGGEDADPASRITGGPTIATIATAVGGTGLTDTGILVQVYLCTEGVKYILEVYCDRSDGDIAEASTHFVCKAPS